MIVDSCRCRPGAAVRRILNVSLGNVELWNCGLQRRTALLPRSQLALGLLLFVSIISNISLKVEFHGREVRTPCWGYSDTGRTSGVAWDLPGTRSGLGSSWRRFRCGPPCRSRFGECWWSRAYFEPLSGTAPDLTSGCSSSCSSSWVSTACCDPGKPWGCSGATSHSPPTWFWEVKIAPQSAWKILKPGVLAAEYSTWSFAMLPLSVGCGGFLRVFGTTPLCSPSAGLFCGGVSPSFATRAVSALTGSPPPASGPGGPRSCTSQGCRSTACGSRGGGESCRLWSTTCRKPQQYNCCNVSRRTPVARQPWCQVSGHCLPLLRSRPVVALRGMDRIESLMRTFRRAAGSQMGEQTFAELSLPAHRELLIMESKLRGAANVRATKEFAKVILALEDLEKASPRLPASSPPRGADAAAGALALVPVRMQPPGAVVKARAAAAGPLHSGWPPASPWQRVWKSIRLWLQCHRWWISTLLAILFPRLGVAVVMRTGKSLTSQFWLEVKSWGMDGIQHVITAAAEALESVESAMINTTSAAMPQILGAGIVAFIAYSSQATMALAALPALPP